MLVFISCPIITLSIYLSVLRAKKTHARERRNTSHHKVGFSMFFIKLECTGKGITSVNSNQRSNCRTKTK